MTQQSERLPGSVPGGGFASVQIQRLNVRVPNVGNTQYLDSTINTSGDFMEGQKTVLGKVSGVEDDTAIFVVIAL